MRLTIAAVALALAAGCGDDEGGATADAAPVDAAPVADATPWDGGPCDPLQRWSCYTPCRQPDPGNVVLCGYIHDVETRDWLWTANSCGIPCDSPEADPDGPCRFAIRVAEASPIELRMNDCGRFNLEIPAPAGGVATVVVDDASDATDRFAPTARRIPVNANLRHDRVTIYALAHTTDAAWTSTAGDPFAGATFSEVGAQLSLFTHKAAPVSGVAITVDGTVRADADYYFADSDPETLTTIAPTASATGANGAGLVVGTSSGNYSGQGSESMLESCVWGTAAGGPVPGALVVLEQPSRDPGSGEICE